MKKMLLVMAASALVVVGTAQAQSETVTSVNVVGYISTTIPAGGLALVTPVLESFEGGTIVDIDGGQLPNGSEAYIWDRTTHAYIPLNKSTRGAWSGAGGAETNLILRGDALWIRPNSATDVTLTSMGEVPGEYNLAGTTTVANIDGVDAVGYSYPVDILFTNTALPGLLPNGSALYVWDVVSQGYTSYNKSVRGAWNLEANSLVLKAGNGFWITTPSLVDWDETVPYDL